MLASGIAVIKNGKIDNPFNVSKIFMSLKDGRYEFEIKAFNKRSNQQNRYYFKCVEMIRDKMNESGNEFTKEQVHDWIKWKFNSVEFINEDTGEIERIPQSTTSLGKDKFSELIEKIHRYAAESLDLVIPDPGEQMKIYEDD